MFKVENSASVMAPALKNKPDTTPTKNETKGANPSIFSSLLVYPRLLFLTGPWSRNYGYSICVAERHVVTIVVVSRYILRDQVYRKAR